MRDLRQKHRAYTILDSRQEHVSYTILDSRQKHRRYAVGDSRRKHRGCPRAHRAPDRPVRVYRSAMTRRRRGALPTRRTVPRGARRGTRARLRHAHPRASQTKTADKKHSGLHYGRLREKHRVYTIINSRQKHRVHIMENSGKKHRVHTMENSRQKHRGTLWAIQFRFGVTQCLLDTGLLLLPFGVNYSSSLMTSCTLHMLWRTSRISSNVSRLMRCCFCMAS